jgi:TRAP-type transport system periplasmic protein
LGCLMAVTASTAAAPVNLKLGTLAPDGSDFDVIIRDMGEEWKTAGVNLSIYPGGVLGDEPDMVTKMRLGQIQVGVKMQPVLEARLLAKGFKVLNWGEAGWVYFFGKEPVLTPTQLKKMKFFVWGNDADAMGIWKSAGFSPVPLAATDILPNLQTGLINCFDTTPVSALSFQWFALAPHMTDLKWAPLVGATIITTKAWAKVPAASQPAVLKAAATAGKRFRDEIRAKEKLAIDAMKQKGLKVHTITPAQAKEWEDLFTGTYPQISGHIIPADMMAMAIKFRDEYRAKAPKK